MESSIFFQQVYVIFIYELLLEHVKLDFLNLAEFCHIYAVLGDSDLTVCHIYAVLGENELN